MYDLGTFTLSDMVTASAALRHLGEEAASMEEVARRTVAYFRDQMGSVDGRRAIALARFYKTHPCGDLEDDIQALARQALGHDRAVGWEDVACLTLLASNGDLEPWNDRRHPSGQPATPLPDIDAVGRSGLASPFLEQLGIDLDALLDPDPDRVDILEQAYDVFHLECAGSSPALQLLGEAAGDQAIRSVLGFGGVLPTGELFGVLLYSRVAIPRSTADLFRTIALSVKVALLPFAGGPIFDGLPALTTEPPPLRAEVVALRQLLETQERAAIAQTRRLEQATRALRDESRLAQTVHHIGNALSSELELDRVVQTVTDTATQLTGAEFGAFFYNVADEAGERYTLYSLSGVDASAFAGFPMPRNTAIFGPTFRGEGTVRHADVTASPAYGRNTPYRGMPEGHLPVRSYLAVPVRSRDGREPIGGLFLGHADVDVFTEADARLVEGIAVQAAIAFDNAILFRQAEVARNDAERSAEQVRRLQTVTAALSMARSRAEVSQVIVDQGAAGVDAAGCVVCLLADGGSNLEIVAVGGYDPQTLQTWQSVPVDAQMPIGDAIRRRDMVLIPSLADRDVLYPDLAGADSANEAFATCPLIVGGEPIGAVTFSWAESRQFVSHELNFMASLAEQCAQALERARLYEVEQLAADRQRFLAEASRALASSLDYQAILRQLADLAVPELGDSCSIHVQTDHGLELVAMNHVDPDGRERMQRLAEKEPPAGNRGLAQIASSQQSTLFTTFDDDLWNSMARDEEHLALLRAQRTRSAMGVPMVTGGRTIGVLALTVGISGRDYTEADLPVVEDLAARAAVAIENARAHSARSEVARTLQASLLPPHLLAVPGLDLASRYHATAEGNEVTGDFYDVFRAGKGRWGVVMGDVCGKGVPAASLTALARYTVRAAALREDTPSAVLQVVNEAILEHGVDERFCTVAHLLVEPATAGAHVTLSCGGHPLPLLLDVDGSVTPVGEPGTAIGMFPSPRLTDTEFTLQPGQALVLFTDGLTEARSPSGEFAPDLMATVLAGCAGADAETIAQLLMDSVLAFEGGLPRDDMALLVMRVPPAGAATEGTTSDTQDTRPLGARGASTRPGRVFDERYPNTAAAVSVARHQLSGWFDDYTPGLVDAREELLLAAAELATNAARVARTGFRLRAWIEPDGAVIELSDDGPGFDGPSPDPDLVPDLASEGGRGLYLVHALVDDVRIQSDDSGTVVTCRKRI